MSRGRDNITIELSSSPEPESPRKAKHSRSHLAKFYSTSTSSFVIELSDGDEGDGVPSSPKSLSNAVAGPSTRPLQASKLALANSSSSIENIPLEHRKVKASASKIIPLFLPSDEENTPPDELSKTQHFASSPIHSPHTDITQEPIRAQPASPTGDPSSQIPPEDNAESDMEVDAPTLIMNRVYEIIPDVEPDYLLALATKHISDHQDQTQDFLVELIVHALFEDPKYPKIDRMNKGKRKQSENDVDASPQKKAKIDYSNKNRPYTPTKLYAELALDHLQTSFPLIPKSYFQSCLTSHKGLYAPTHLFLLEQEKTFKQRREAGERVRLPYHKRIRPYSTKRKDTPPAQDPEFEAEHAWLLSELSIGNTTENPDDQEEDCEDGIECGCCFSTCSFDKMIQCPETHLFCNTCMTSYASTLLGSHDTNIKCMDQSGCKELFSHSELERFLSPKLMDLYERVKQRKEVEAAGLEGLEECPFCEWGCVIENPEEKLLRCGNTENCGAVSCRSCKKLDHLPKSCKEMEEDKHLDGRHAVEEAMSQALMRNCPKCQKAFIKESGCNKMSCPNCATLSCYVCREIVTGYEHFNQREPNQPGGSRDPNKEKCPLWDPVEQRHAIEVKAAAERALAQYKSENPDVDEKDIKVDLPTAPPPLQADIPYVQRMLQNAEAELRRLTEDLVNLRVAETRQRESMSRHEQKLQHLQSLGRPPTCLEYQRLLSTLARDQTAWYQRRIDVQGGEARVATARAQVEIYRQQAANRRAQPAWNLNLNLNFQPYAPLMPLPAAIPPVAPPVARRTRGARAPKRRR